MTPDNATLIERIVIDPTLLILRIRPDSTPPTGQKWFVPGQYVSIGMESIQRAYSIASEPEERRWIEFYIRFAREPATTSPLTHRLWKLAVGSRLHVGEKIVGRFTLERTVVPGDPRDKLFVGAGTGLAPFVSMVRHARRVGDLAGLARFVVFHGVSHPHELGYDDELTAAASEAGVRYFPTISRPTEHAEWTGLTGRVETLLDKGRVPEVDLRPERTIVYVCGFKDTIANSVRKLLGRGFVPEDRRLRKLIGVADDAKPSLFFEQYDLEPIFDPNDKAAIAALRASLPRGA